MTSVRDASPTPQNGGASRREVTFQARLALQNAIGAAATFCALAPEGDARTIAMVAGAELKAAQNLLDVEEAG